MTAEDFCKFQQLISSTHSEDHRLFVSTITRKLSEKNIIAFILLMKDLYLIDNTVGVHLKEEIDLFYKTASPLFQIYLCKQEELISRPNINTDISLTKIVEELYSNLNIRSGCNIAAAKFYYTKEINRLFTTLENSIINDTSTKSIDIKMQSPPDLLTDDDLPF